MPSAISLRKVADEIDMCSVDAQAYLNQTTGECYTIRDDEVEETEETDGGTGWEQEKRAKNREVLASEEWIELPERAAFHEYRVMQEFCEGVPGEKERAELFESIGGKGAFRRFKDNVARVGLRDEWFAFRDQALRQFVAAWLEAQTIAYVD